MVRQLVDAAQQVGELVGGEVTHLRTQHRLGDDQFAHHVHQLVDFLEIDADRSGGLRGVGGLVGCRGRCGNCKCNQESVLKQEQRSF